MSSMNTELFDALASLAKEKGISAEILVEKIQTALVIAIKKDYPRSENIDFDIDIAKGKFEVCINKEIVETVEEIEDEANQIDLAAAKKVSKKYKVGDLCAVKLNTRHFGRIAAQTAKQVMKQGIKEIERDQLIQQWADLQDKVVGVKVLKVEPDTGNAVVEIDSTEIVLFKDDQIPGESINTGDVVKVYILGVSASDRRPMLRVSRTHNNMVKKLFENEVPEISDGIIEVKSVSREAGSRAKVAVISNDENVDALGSCIGPERSRINAICEELNGEKMDIVLFNEDPCEFIKQALKPADVLFVDIPDDESRTCTVTVPDSQLSLAIGGKGQNVKLAARLVGYKIDIRPESGFYKGGSAKEQSAKYDYEEYSGGYDDFSLPKSSYQGY